MKRLNKRTQKKENRFQLGPRRLLGESLEQRNLFSTISPAGADLQIVGDREQQYGSPTFDTTENWVGYDSPGDDTFRPVRIGYDSPGDDTFRPVRVGYDSPGDDSFAVLPSLQSNETLTFQSYPEAFGTARVTVVLADSDGAGNGGVDRSPAQTFTITVKSRNDPPSLTFERRDAEAGTVAMAGKQQLPDCAQFRSQLGASMATV